MREVSIEGLLHWAYGTERVHLGVLEGPGGGEAVDLDGGGSGGAGGAHDDALAVESAVGQLTRADRRLVIQYAAAGVRPPVHTPERLRAVPVLGFREVRGERRARSEYEFPERFVDSDGVLVHRIIPPTERVRRQQSPLWTPIKWLGPREDAHGRSKSFPLLQPYGRWRGLLVLLRAHFVTGPKLLKEHRISDVLPPECPGAEKKPVAFSWGTGYARSHSVEQV